MNPSLSQAAIALGSNLGDSLQILEAALTTLATTPGVALLGRSPWYRTRPLGPPQPDYLNGCATLTVQMTPPQLLTTLLEIETQFGRERQQHWGARTLDLDLLLFDDLILRTPELQIPHPRMNDRAFVLVPLATIAPDWVEPISGQAIAHLLSALDCSGVNLIEQQ
ncbi:2-amino-4-hydroxy-6-hydroxymethyldihydropteridine pyrophosphokinase [Neosynechococcus sphagnicola sy1]|uniref:2-amino-4-hydroxy-6-hydroxymethyldihydropteridine diphosphokinase n=1 Tax=Neosynechococcus sphagnicola sy1 TaxID=1497020 RepID=A0A098TNS1_9CYAN|nr:2-amino-4-hydroxy-6-hydroxymethyldihydropteridine diphosphokinase [Neosynechococcus sphagnicola]KGF73517.1 2-amino-4-hydroxy-6-hydroxymethyldihydropteridine pyrophosphokinase [Neosynechococcus sphagnicola sy1]